MTTHLVIGAGAVGSGTARNLADAGDHVRVVTRSGSGPVHPDIELVQADATHADRLAELTAGAATIFNCANPHYTAWATDWPPLASAMLTAAERCGARLAIMGNLYGYAKDASPMRATDELDPPSRKGAIRVAMWDQALEAHRAGRVEVTEIRASDFFGPGVGDTAHLGDRVVPRLLAGKGISVLGRSDQPHSWSYIGDVCSALAVLGTDDRSYGRAWHVPTLEPMTAKAMADAMSDAAGVARQKVRSIPLAIVRAAGVFSATMRELPEMGYQFDRPFVIDAEETVDTFGVCATPLAEQIDATIASYRS